MTTVTDQEGRTSQEEEEEVLPEELVDPVEMDRGFSEERSDILDTNLPKIVGSRLGSFLEIWKEWCQDQWVVDILRRGYRIEFQETPRFQGVRIIPVPRDSTKRNALLGKVDELLAKSAIGEVKGNFQEGFYSTIFLAPKKNGTWRPVINLKKYIKKFKFKMTTLKQIIQEV